MTSATMKPILEWLEEVPFTKESALRNIAREFSDGYCVAEIVAHFCPKLIDMNVYHPVSATPQKVTQWNTLNKKCLQKLECAPPKPLIQKVVDYKEGAAELILRNLKLKVEHYLKPERKDSAGPTRGEVQVTAPGDKAAKKKGKKKKHGKDALNREPTSMSSGGADATADARAVELACAEKEQIIEEYVEVVGVFQTKVKELERLLKLKDRRIEDLVRKCKDNGIAVVNR